MEQTLQRLKEITREVQLLEHINALLGWDQETYMPKGAVEERGEQLALLQGLLHRKSTDPEIGDLLGRLGATEENPMGSGELKDLDKRFIRTVFRLYNRETKLPESLVTEMARLSSKALAVWGEARKENDFSKFAPYLEKLVQLNREKAKCFGFTEHPYDPLLDEFEPWIKTREVEKVFFVLREDLAELLGRIREKPQVKHDFLFSDYSVKDQEIFAKSVLKDLGYEDERGRLDLSTHPFTTTLGADDVRITTRYNNNFFPTGLCSVIHEAGHALYELGMGPEIKGTILSGGTSLGIHESQSRMWENMVGRSRSFWKHYYPKLKDKFPSALGSTSLEGFYKAFNKVEPTFIRVEADEVTYSLHIILRFEIELQLITDSLKVREVPEYWNSTFKRLFGVTPKDDREGCLQDIHWSMGAFGYFPTYALGNLYAAQFFNTLKREMPGLEGEIEKGNFPPLLSWLREKIHYPGNSMTAEELVKSVTGEPLNSRYFVEYLNNKYREIYDL